MNKTSCEDEIIKLLAPRLEHPHSLRTGETKRRPWVCESGRPDLLNEKAKCYIRSFDFKEVLKLERFEKQTIILGKAVCNLRNYFKQSKAQTIDIVETIYNRISKVNWSAKDIGLIWEVVEGYTPSLGIGDERAIAMQRKEHLIDEIIYILAQMVSTSSERTSFQAFFDLFNNWNPDLFPSQKAFGDAMRVVTGKATTPSNGVSYYHGFTLPIGGVRFINKEVVDICDRYLAVIHKQAKKEGIA